MYMRLFILFLISVFFAGCGVNDDIHNKALKELEEKKAALKQALSESEVAKKEIAGLRKIKQGNEQKIKELSTGLTAGEKKIKELSAGLSAGEQQIKDISAKSSAALDAKKSELDQAMSELDTAKKEIAGLQKSIQANEQQINELSAGLSAREQEIKEISATSSEALDAKKAELDRALSESQVANKEIAGLRKAKQENEQQIIKISAALSTREQQIKDLSAREKTGLQKIMVVGEQLAGLQREREHLLKLDEIRAEKVREIPRLTNTIMDKERQIKALSARISAKDEQIKEISARENAALGNVSAISEQLAGLQREREHLMRLDDVRAEKEIEIPRLTNAIMVKEEEIKELSESISAKDALIEEISAKEKIALDEVTFLGQKLLALQREREFLINLNTMISEKEQEIPGLKNTIMAKEEQIKELSEGISGKDAMIEEISAKEKVAIEEVAFLEEKLSGYQREREFLINQDAVFSEKEQKIPGLKNTIVAREEQIKELSTKIDEITAKEQSTMQEVASLETELSGFQREREFLISQDAIFSEKEQEIPVLKNTIIAKEAEIKELSKSIAAKDAMIEEISAKEKAAMEEVVFVEGKLSGFQREREFLMRADEMSAEKVRELAALKRTYENLVESLEGEVARGEIKLSRATDSLLVNIVDKILFDSGKVKIKKSGRDVLQRIGDILENVNEQQIMIKGHTDNVPIGTKLKEKFPSNWELSATRAINVVSYLQRKVGISPKILSATGYSEYRPVSSNDTFEGRAQNRRIEIALLPLDAGKVLKGLKK